MDCKFSAITSLAHGRKDTCAFCGKVAEEVVVDKNLPTECRAQAQRRLSQYADRQSRVGQHRPLTTKRG